MRFEDIKKILKTMGYVILLPSILLFIIFGVNVGLIFEKLRQEDKNS